MAKELHTSAREVQTIAGNQLRNPQAQNRRHVARMVIVFILGKCLKMLWSYFVSWLDVMFGFENESKTDGTGLYQHAFTSKTFEKIF